jgi:GINS complex subunit 2
MKVGPFNANQEATVPFWLAVMLKEKNKCKILAPFWLVETELTQFIEREKKNVDELISLQND